LPDHSDDWQVALMPVDPSKEIVYLATALRRHGSVTPPPGWRLEPESAWS
jgi:hypothetical protein